MPALPKTDQRLEKGLRTRLSLLEAGLKLFALKGFDAVSTRELATQSGVNSAAINFHFGSKAGLYAAVIEHVTKHLATLYREALSPATALPQNATRSQAGEAVHSMVTRLIGSLLMTPRSRWMSLLLQREFIDPTEAFDRIFDDALLPALDAFARVVESASAKPRASLDNKALAFGVFVLACAFSRSRATFLKWSGKDIYTPQDVADISRAVADFSLNGLLGGAESAKPSVDPK
ncbi:MAG: CerR family C-terminal domain-containing protein [Desulfovibrio sp.]|nr:CerR family C-terminal domain-containing protein [Desulfovibrio sp.]MBI4958494.1 CerR family C-terminal domain-containing protein [Desulfovibrio sp.]